MLPPTFADGNTSILYFVLGLSLWVMRCMITFFLGSGFGLPVVLVVAVIACFSFFFGLLGLFFVVDSADTSNRFRLLSPGVPDGPECL